MMDKWGGGLTTVGNLITSIKMIEALSQLDQLSSRVYQLSPLFH